MTQENEFSKLGLEINALEDFASPSSDLPDQDGPAHAETIDREATTFDDFVDMEKSAEEEPPADVEGDDPLDPLITINEQIQELTRQFESKLKYDEHKNKIIDDLHHAMQEYRQGFLQKYLQRVFIDVIKIIDDMRKFVSHHNTSASDVPVEKILKFITNTASDIEDIFAWEGITPYTCQGEYLDISRQRVVDKIETDDPARDKTIARRLRPGYEYEGRILRPELVNIYVFPNNHTPDDRKI
jgi:molecular chaperone GrpE (heat shock protein)